MAPEMAHCENNLLGYCSDIYLLGGILFQMLTGSPPHSAPTTYLKLESAADNTIPSVDTPGGLDEILRKALATNPDERYATVNEFRDAVKDASLRHKCERLCRTAESVLQEAINDGNYRDFDQAITLYENALALRADYSTAAVGKVQAALAYARTALAKAEYDLASTIIAPLIPKSDAAAILSETIGREKRVSRARRRRNRILLVSLITLTIISALIIRRHYWQTRQELDVVSKKVAGASQFYESMHYSNQLQMLQMDMPGGMNYESVRFSIPEFESIILHPTKEQEIELKKKREQQRLKEQVEKRQDEKKREVTEALERILGPAKNLTKIKDAVTKEQLEDIARAIKRVEPQLRTEISKIRKMGRSEELNPYAAQKIAFAIERLIKQADEILN